MKIYGNKESVYVYMMSSVYKYYEEGKESKERYELESPLLERCIEEWSSVEKCVEKCKVECGVEKCKGVCSEENSVEKCKVECGEEKCKVECGVEKCKGVCSVEKCKGVCSEESDKIERMLKYVCAPSNLDMSNYKISWLFKEYYHEIIIPGDKSFKI
jgi:hypothetical protein